MVIVIVLGDKEEMIFNPIINKNEAKIMKFKIPLIIFASLIILTAAVLFINHQSIKNQERVAVILPIVSTVSTVQVFESETKTSFEIYPDAFLLFQAPFSLIVLNHETRKHIVYGVRKFMKKI
jgi:hypothetical protein